MKPITKTKPITKEQLLHRAALIKDVEHFDQFIMRRLDYIMKTVFRVCKITKLNWWLYEPDNGKDAVDFLINSFEGGDALVVEFLSSGELPLFYYKDGELADLCDEGIRPSWLTEDFEDELIEGRAKYMEGVKAEKKAEAEKKRILNKAMQKLSSKEKAALGLK